MHFGPRSYYFRGRGEQRRRAEDCLYKSKKLSAPLLALRGMSFGCSNSCRGVVIACNIMSSLALLPQGLSALRYPLHSADLSVRV